MNFRHFLIEVAKPYMKWFYGMLFVGVYSSIHNVVQPYVLKIILDSAAAANADGTGFLDACLMPSFVLIALGFIITFIWRLYNYIILKSLPSIKAHIITVTTEHLRGQSFSFFQDQLSGDLSNKISDLTSNIQNIINTWFNITRQGLTIFLSIAMAGIVSLYFSLIFLIVSLAFIFIAYYCSNSIRPYARDYAEARSRNIGNIVDCFSNALNMLLFAREKYEKKYLEITTNKSVEKDRKMQFKNMLNATLLGTFAWILNALSILLLLYLGDKGLVTVGDFAFIFILSITVIDQIWALTENLLVVGEQVGICQQAVDLIFTKHQQVSSRDSAELTVSRGEITMRNISFGYTPEIKTLNNIDIHIPGGNKVGLVGYSGAGKSTLVALITRLFDIQKGEILIDNQNINSVPINSLREHISFIPQTPSLFHRSIYENILYGNVDATREQVVAAAKLAHADDFIRDLPNGYDTVVGERGIKLSGGQRQRVAIARAILKDAPILILDEATSSLDSVTEKLIQESIAFAMQNRTVIVIAHRLSTILSMDNIFVLDNGNIIESGSHNELIASNGFYKSLWDTQSGHSLI